MIVQDNIDSIYLSLLEKILSIGTDVDDKGGYVELIGESFKLTNPRNRIVQNPRRKISLSFQLAECIWIFSGNNDLEMIAKYAPKWSDFSDDGITLHGAYGSRLSNWYGLDQIKNIVEVMTKNKLTRQAMMVIFDPKKDLTYFTKDVPCNTILQFFIRNNQLHLVTYVRSQDMILGLPYDLFHWTIFQEWLSLKLGVEVGEYITHYGSVHIYNRDIQKSKEILRENNYDIIPMSPMPVTNDDIFKNLYADEHMIRNNSDIKYKYNDWWLDWLKVFAQKNNYDKFGGKEINQEVFKKVMCL